VLKLALSFLGLAALMAVLGYTDFAQGAASAAKIFFFIFLVLFCVEVAIGKIRKNADPPDAPPGPPAGPPPGPSTD
jgi:uncharacterized membrane protein YtjA (UPF0391 family)